MVRSALQRSGWTLGAAACLWLVVAGCSGQNSASPPPAAAPPLSQPPPAATPITTAPGQPPDLAAASGEAASRLMRQAARPLPDVPASQLAEVGTDIPNFELIAAGDPRSGAVVALVAPPAGLDSSTVELVAPVGEAGGVRSLSVQKPPTGFSILSDAGISPEGLPLRLRCETDGAEMALVPAGLFLQGSNAADANAAPLHPVQLDNYYIDIHEVTLARYRRYYEQKRPLPGRPVNKDDPDDHPALGITWRDAAGYCAWAGKELPTEAEWEKAARGPNELTYPWGHGRVLWHRPRTPDQIDPVGAFPADRSIYGVFDLAGNAREWCADHYAPDAYHKAAGPTGAVVVNWTGPSQASPPAHRVVRGNAPGWELWHRTGAPMLSPPGDVGFRGVLRWPRGGSTAGPADATQPPTATPRAARRTN